MYTALYRKFRPKFFSEVKGQETVITTLKNQIKSDRIGHAYLFCGTRGTGKTSVAKIFAKAVNCENPKDGEPCGECRICKAIADGSSMNVVEMDAASNNGVDAIRQIRDDVGYTPPEGRFTVYIVDEAHMLTDQAFNALLKTLEEPPSHVIFILATTEARKILDTILSRCQRYDFRRIEPDVIAGHLMELLKIEGVSAEDKAVDYIARMADGSMRDALSLLDQAIAFYLGQELTYDRVLSALGGVDTELFSRLYAAILEENIKEALEVVNEAMMSGRDLSLFVSDFCWYLRNLLLAKNVEDITGLVDLSSQDMETLQDQAKQSSVNALMRYIGICSELSSSLRFSAQKRILTEVAMIRLMKSESDTDLTALLERMDKMEAKLEKGIPVRQAETVVNVVSVQDNKPSEKKKIVLPAVSEDIKELKRVWPELVESLDIGKMVRSVIKEPIQSPKKEDTICFIVENNIGYDTLSDEKLLDEMKTACEERIGKKIQIEIVNKLSAGKEEIDLLEAMKEKINMEITEEE